MSDERVVFWKVGEDADICLSLTEIDEAVEAALDMMPLPLPSHLTVHGYARVTGCLGPDGGDLIEYAWERIDEEWGDPDGRRDLQECFGGWDEVRGMAERLSEAINRNYIPWACERVTSKSIDVRRWVRENRPDWIVTFREESLG